MNLSPFENVTKLSPFFEENVDFSLAISTKIIYTIDILIILISPSVTASLPSQHLHLLLIEFFINFGGNEE